MATKTHRLRLSEVKCRYRLRHGKLVSIRGRVITGKQARINGVAYKRYKVVWMLANNLEVPRGKEIDHRDRDRSNDRPHNLRPASRSENNANSIPRNGKRYKGVYARKHFFCAYITARGVRRYLGSYPTEHQAALAYNRAARKAFGKFARLNHVH